MQISYSSHAQKRIKQRRISKSHIIKTLKNPENKEKSFKGRIVVNKQFPNKILEIVYIEEKDSIIIITLYYL